MPKAKTPKTQYQFNHYTQRWEPRAVAPSPPREASRRKPSPPRPPPRKWGAQRAVPRPARLVVAECEAEARVDAANGFCSFSQAPQGRKTSVTWCLEAMAVRLALRFESRPSDILDSASVHLWLELFRVLGWPLKGLVASSGNER